MQNQQNYKSSTKSKVARSRARALRREMTRAEHKIWEIVRRRQIDGNYFRRQVPIGKYIADFACLKSKLIIEVDGGQHYSAVGAARDAIRTRDLEALGYHVLRFSNSEALQKTEGVFLQIRGTLKMLELQKLPPS